jgi:hypothetical protein
LGGAGDNDIDADHPVWDDTADDYRRMRISLVDTAYIPSNRRLRRELVKTAADVVSGDEDAHILVGRDKKDVPVLRSEVGQYASASRHIGRPDADVGIRFPELQPRLAQGRTDIGHLLHAY